MPETSLLLFGWFVFQCASMAWSLYMVWRNRRLKDDLAMLRALERKCVRCHELHDRREHLVKFEVWGPHGMEDPCPDEFSSVCWFGGGVGGRGVTAHDAIDNAAKNAKEALPHYFDDAALAAKDRK